MSIYGQIIILLACYRAIRICTNETHDNKYTTPLATNNKTIFLFECPMTTKTICSSSETSNVTISLQQPIKSSRAKVIIIYEAGSTDCIMEQTKTKNFIQCNYQLSPIIFMKVYVIHKSFRRRFEQFLV